MSIRSIAVAVLIAGTALAQSADPNAAFVNEIRLLRQSLDNLVVSNLRIQVAFDRARLQRRSLFRVEDQISAVSQEQTDLAGQVARRQQDLKGFESLLINEREPQRRTELQDEIGTAKADIEALRAKSYMLQNRLADLNSNLRLEKSKLQELDQELDQVIANLENELAARAKRP
jgi:chromosome segregation ATPase